MKTDDIYKNLLRDALQGEKVVSRGHTTTRVIGVSIEFTSTPLITLRRVAWRSALKEFEWFMSGSTRVSDLPIAVQPWWSPWGDGVGYGKAYNVLRRGDFSIWDPEGPLPPCAYTAFAAKEFSGGLVTSMLQRSCDLMCGAPHDWFQLWCYSMWLAKERRIPLRSVRWACTDAHVYDQHRDGAHNTIWQTSFHSPNAAYMGSTGDPFRADNFTIDREYLPSLTQRMELIV